jgi:hypothetical protein
MNKKIKKMESIRKLLVGQMAKENITRAEKSKALARIFLLDEEIIEEKEKQQAI